MLDDLKKLFSQSWAAFLDEAQRREPADEVAGLLAAMRREMVDARAALPLYEKNVLAATAELERERRALDDAVRRGGMASRIGDAETVRVAEEFAERHRKRVAVLEEKARAADAFPATSSSSTRPAPINASTTIKTSDRVAAMRT